MFTPWFISCVWLATYLINLLLFISLPSAMLSLCILEQYLPSSSFDFLSPQIKASKGLATCPRGVWIEEKMRKVKKARVSIDEILTEWFYSVAGGRLLHQIFWNASLQWCPTERDKISCGTIIWFVSLYQPLEYLKPTGNCPYSMFSQFFKHL